MPTSAASISASEAAIAVASRFPWSRKMMEYSAAAKASASPASARKNRSHACESILSSSGCQGNFIRSSLNVGAGCLPALLPVPPQRHQSASHHQQGDVRSLHDLQEPFPLAAEVIAECRHRDYPGQRTQKVVQQKSYPLHPQHSRQGSGEDAHAKKNAGNKDG